MYEQGRVETNSNILYAEGDDELAKLGIDA